MSRNPHDLLFLRIVNEQDGQHATLNLSPKQNYMSGTDPDDRLPRMTYMAGVLARAAVTFLARAQNIEPVDHVRYEKDPTLQSWEVPEHWPCSGRIPCSLSAMVDRPEMWRGEMAFRVTVPAAFADEAARMLPDIVKQVAEHDTRLILSEAEMTIETLEPET